MVFGKVNYLNAMDTRQYLYCLTPKPEIIKELKVLKGVTNIGKLDIVWKTNMGERGRLQTSQLQRVVCIIGILLIIIITFSYELWLNGAGQKIYYSIFFVYLRTIIFRFVLVKVSSAQTHRAAQHVPGWQMGGCQVIIWNAWP